MDPIRFAGQMKSGFPTELTPKGDPVEVGAALSLIYSRFFAEDKIDGTVFDTMLLDFIKEACEIEAMRRRIFEKIAQHNLEYCEEALNELRSIRTSRDMRNWQRKWPKAKFEIVGTNREILAKLEIGESAIVSTEDGAKVRVKVEKV